MLEILKQRIEAYREVYINDPVYFLTRDVAILELKHLADLYVEDLKKNTHNMEWHKVEWAEKYRDEIRAM